MPTTTTKTKRKRTRRAARRKPPVCWEDGNGQLIWHCPQCHTDNPETKRACACEYVRPALEKLQRVQRPPQTSVVPTTQSEAAAKEAAAAGLSAAQPPAIRAALATLRGELLAAGEDFKQRAAEIHSDIQRRREQLDREQEDLSTAHDQYTEQLAARLTALDVIESRELPPIPELPAAQNGREGMIQLDEAQHQQTVQSTAGRGDVPITRAIRELLETRPAGVWLDAEQITESISPVAKQPKGRTLRTAVGGALKKLQASGQINTRDGKFQRVL